MVKVKYRSMKYTSSMVLKKQCITTNNYLGTIFTVLDSPWARPLNMEIANGKGS